MAANGHADFSLWRRQMLAARSVCRDSDRSIIYAVTDNNAKGKPVKIKLDLDATPQELRTFFGLPDLQPLQNEMLDNIREKMSAGVEGFDASSLMKPFLPENMHSMQKQFWDAMTQAPEKKPPSGKQ